MGRIVDRKYVTEIADRLRSEKRKIVFTNGCFDILHAGHVRYLNEAKTFGDVLIVGLNADRSIRAIKEDRPIISEQERAEVLSALAVVDYVVLFDEDTPFELIKSVMPHVLVKGGDWHKDDIIGADLVEEVHSLPYHEGLSTTEIIDRIRSFPSS